MQPIATIDFETRSEAGLHFDPIECKWKSADPDASPQSQKKGLSLVGSWVYSEHPSTAVLCLAYNLPNQERQLWAPGDPYPTDLFDYIASGGLIEAHNSAFEYAIWRNVCFRRMGWPPLPYIQTRDSMALARAMSLPGSLDAGTKALFGEQVKDPVGKELIKFLCIPKKPTKADPTLWHGPSNPPEKYPDAFERLYAYCLKDIEAEEMLSGALPPLGDYETQVWLLDQLINYRGVQIDREFVRAAIECAKVAKQGYDREIFSLTGGAVAGVSKAADLTRYVNELCKPINFKMWKMDEEAVTEALSIRRLPPNARKALELRQKGAGSAIAKLPAMEYCSSTKDDRIRGLHAYQGADRTGRWAGRMVQSQNLPNKGPKAVRCSVLRRAIDANIECNHPGSEAGPNYCVRKPLDWGIETIEQIIEDTKAGKLFERWTDPIGALSGAIRGAFVAAEGKEFISSDFSAIEGVVLACLAGEEWKVEAYRTHGKLYELTASKVSGVSFEEILAHKEETGSHHPLRKVGKVGELASGFGGGLAAWLNFNADEFLSNKEIKAAIKAWREAHPQTVALWKGLENAAKAAIEHPGVWYNYRDIWYILHAGSLWCYLPSGRPLVYQRARLKPIKVLSSPGWDIVNAEDDKKNTAVATAEATHGVWFDYNGISYINDLGKLWCRLPDGPSFSYPLSWKAKEAITAVFWKWDETIAFHGNNTAPKKGEPRGFVELETYGGKLCENVVQATARDLLADSMLRVEAAGFPIVLHIHDEIVAEVPKGSKTVEELERIMSECPQWANGWPIKAAGGWIGKRFRKD